MKKNLLIVLLMTNNYVFADEDSTQDASTSSDASNQQQLNVNNNYISPQSYTQNPYLSMTSGGGTQSISESQLASQNVAQKLFSDGTWNILGEASYINQNGANNFGYGANIFAQTGQIAGFSFGSMLTIMNPFLSTKLNPVNQDEQAQTLPIVKQVTPQELFVEYQAGSIFQTDIGWIGISNSPWMTNYQNNALNLVTYQGALFNLAPGGNWLITGFAINGSQLIGEEGFSQQTMYNQTFDFGTGTANIANEGSPGTLAIGASWATPENMLNLRLWGYQFLDYANLLYADSTLKLDVSDNLSFSVGAQGAVENANGTNILYNAGYGNVSSNMVGLQLGMTYDIFQLQLGYNNVWGPNNSYEGGGIVSPYTYQYATDPLYTTGFMLGMVEKGTGSAYKIAPSLNLLGGALNIAPSYEYFATTNISPSAEYDLTASYNIKQVKGLTIFGGFGYTQQAEDAGGNVYQGQIMFSYLY